MLAWVVSIILAKLLIVHKNRLFVGLIHCQLEPAKYSIGFDDP